MNRLQRCKVAGHVFGIEMDADSALWQMMEEPYGPFETAEDGLLFCVRLNAAVARPETAVQVYSNEDSVEPGFIALGVWRDECGHYFEFTQPGSDCVNGCLYIDNGLKDASLSLEGDGNLTGMERCTADDVLAVAARILKDNKEIDCRSARHMRRAMIWKRLKPLRRYMLAIYRIINF